MTNELVTLVLGLSISHNYQRAHKSDAYQTPDRPFQRR